MEDKQAIISYFSKSFELLLGDIDDLAYFWLELVKSQPQDIVEVEDSSLCSSSVLVLSVSLIDTLI